MNKCYIERLANKIGFPADAVEFIEKTADMIQKNQSAVFDELLFNFSDNDYSMEGKKEVFINIAKVCNIHEYTVAMIFLLAASEDLENRYTQKGYSQGFFLDTIVDLRYKLLECHNTYEIWGNASYWWYQRFFNMTRFALGRFQYEVKEFPFDCFGAGGYFVQKGDPVLNFHIPSSGVPITDEVRLVSYKKAKEFFFPNKETVAFVCDSWLLWPDYEEYIPEKINLKRFRKDFTVISKSESESFNAAYHVFGKYTNLPPERLPRETRQQRLFADYIKDGGKHGSGYGIFLFDGEKIIR